MKLCRSAISAALLLACASLLLPIGCARESGEADGKPQEVEAPPPQGLQGNPGRPDTVRPPKS